MKALSTFLLLFTILSVNAQWTTDTSANTLVVDSEGGDMKAIGTTDGKTYVVFWKVVAPPTNYELRMQVLDVDGTQMLGPDGILVSNTIPMSTFTVIWSIVTDANDNLYIGATGTGGGEPAYAFKLDISGNHLWGANGVNVGAGFAVTILPLSSGEAIVSWGASAGQALMQKYDASGTGIWGSAQPIVEAANDTFPADMFELSSGDYIMVFHSLGFGVNSTLYAQRYDSAGILQWGTPTQLSNQGTVFNTTYSGLQDGDVIYYGYRGSSGVRFDSYLQRINADGTLPWGINGMDFDTNQTNYEMDTQIAFDPGSQFVWAVCTYTNPSQSEKGEYVQKFDKTTGARQFTDNAKVIYPISGDDNVHVGALQLKNDSPLFLHKRGMDNGATPTTLGVVYLDSNGDLLELFDMATFLANKSRIHYTKRVNNQSVAVFIEDKGSGPRIYAQNLIDEVLAIDEVGTEATIFYNNPVTNTLRIESKTAIETVAIFSILGQEVYSENYSDLLDIAIETASWNSGMYVVYLKNGDGKETKFKILKE